MKRLLLAEPAARDLESTINYIALDNPVAAEKVYRSISGVGRIGRQPMPGLEVKVALDRKAKPAGHGFQLAKANATQFGLCLIEAAMGKVAYTGGGQRCDRRRGFCRGWADLSAGSIERLIHWALLQRQAPPFLPLRPKSQRQPRTNRRGIYGTSPEDVPSKRPDRVRS